MPLTRMTLEERIHVIRLYSKHDGHPSLVQLHWREKFGTEPPTRKTIVALNKKFDDTGSVADLKRNGRPKSSTNPTNFTLVQNAIKRDPTQPLRAIAKDLGINKSSVYRIKKDSEIKGILGPAENRKLKEKILTLNLQVEALERKSNKEKSTISRGFERPSSTPMSRSRRLDPPVHHSATATNTNMMTFPVEIEVEGSEQRNRNFESLSTVDVETVDELVGIHSTLNPTGSTVIYTPVTTTNLNGDHVLQLVPHSVQILTESSETNEDVNVNPLTFQVT